MYVTIESTGGYEHETEYVYGRQGMLGRVNELARQGWKIIDFDYMFSILEKDGKRVLICRQYTLNRKGV